jgi:hypothetical protein
MAALGPPSSTTAANVAAELGDHTEWRVASGMAVESHIRNSVARIAYAAHQPDERKPIDVWETTPTAAAAVPATCNPVVHESLPISPRQPRRRRSIWHAPATPPLRVTPPRHFAWDSGALPVVSRGEREG